MCILMHFIALKVSTWIPTNCMSLKHVTHWIFDTFLSLQCIKNSPPDGSITSSQRDSLLYRLKNGSSERFRRHSVDGTCVDQESEPNKDKRFHPYGRQYSDGDAAGSSLYCCLMECALSESLSPDTTVITDTTEQDSWSPLSTTLQPTMFTVWSVQKLSVSDLIKSDWHDVRRLVLLDVETYRNKRQQQIKHTLCPNPKYFIHVNKYM